ncbi:putative uncharacterized protein FLJ44672 [Papio anubis]|uniref:putative uncharacterized protein FLJ44672 n=1 Tax=Papio anubis TaxID=9555 RepID=UPI0012AD5F84|nr:putative uncharacterized protein FLJ44672 [Papio anubis]
MTTTFGPAPGSLCRPQASLRQAFQVHLQLPGGLGRPSSCLTRASPGPALASHRPPQATFVPASHLRRPETSSSSAVQAHLLPRSSLSRPSSCLLAAFPGHAPAGLSAVSSRPLQA